jgi:DNA-binding response OmpR family regulator
MHYNSAKNFMINCDKKILIVEDESIIALDLKNVLTKKGFQVSAICDTGEEAILLTHNFFPDLILMDIMLKGKLTGIQTAQEINKKFKIPVIFLTASTDVETYLSALKTQPKKYIMKPVEFDLLEKAIADVFAQI